VEERLGEVNLPLIMGGKVRGWRIGEVKGG